MFCLLQQVESNVYQLRQKGKGKEVVVEEKSSEDQVKKKKKATACGMISNFKHI